ncbi:MAG: hypothetical protein HC822_01345 [Oscillochloris sp.]|nr:hypothetical protein [Oscillochloris sp.]
MRRTWPLLFAALLSACSLAAPRSPEPTLVPTVVTPAPSPEPTPIALAETLRNEFGGYSLRYPAGWATNELSGTLTLAPTDAGLIASNPGTGLMITIDATPLATLAEQYGPAAAVDPETFFEVSSGAAQQAGYTISATVPITIDGRSGLAADLSAPGGAGRLVVLIGEDHAVRVLGQAAPDGWLSQRDLFERMVAAIELFAATPSATPTPVNQAAQPLVVDRGPPGFILRIGGSSGPRNGRFTSARGLAVAPDGTLYLAESSRGIWVFSPDGNLITTFGEDELLDAYDIVRNNEDELLVADYGRNAVVRFSADGTFIERWGSSGDGEDQFGLSAPQRIALGPDGSVYALDVRPGLGGVNTSVVRFTQSGEFIERITLPTDLSPADLVIDTNGDILLAETFGGTVVRLDRAGNELARLGDPAAPEQLSAGAIDIDRQGNLYVATYSNGVLKLTPDGSIIAQGGLPASPASIPQPGEFALPNGIVAGPGNVVWVSDNSGEFSAVTALRLVADPVGEATAAAVATAQAPTATAIPAPDLFAQWASEAEASSFYAPDYDPAGATGPPDVEGCQDSPAAWASADPNGLETLELRYRTPVFATQVRVYQNHQPGYISQIELIDERGSASTVYRATPTLVDTCPFTLDASFDQTLTRIVAVRLTIDQRSGANWSEVDAVELIGVR